MSLVENLSYLGDWTAVWFCKLMHSSSALCLHNNYRYSFHHSVSYPRAEYLSWSSGILFGSEECLMLPVEHSSFLCRGLYYSYLQTHSQRTIFRRQWSKNRSTKQKKPLCSPHLCPTHALSWSKDLEDCLKQCWVKCFQAYDLSSLHSVGSYCQYH